MFKVFQEPSEEDLEAAMNTWLEGRPHARVERMSQSESYDKEHDRTNITVVVYYTLKMDI